MKLAFYKGNGNIFDTLIRLWLGCRYSHCELVFSDGVFFSADPRTPGTRFKYITQDPSDWDFVDIHIDTFDENKIRRWCNCKVGKGYDWWGILLSQTFPIGSEDPSRYFCSEVCIEAIKQTQRLNTISSNETSIKDLAILYGLI